MKYNPSLKALMVAASLALLGACSAIKLGYNNAPTVAYTYLSSKVDFDQSQSAQLKTSLSEIVQWHRRNELPGLSRELQQLAQQLGVKNSAGNPVEVSPAQVQQVYQVVRTSLQRTANHSAPLIAGILMKLNAAQLPEIQAALDKSNQDYREDFLNENTRTRHEKLVERTADRYENWLGSLNTQQKARIEKWAHAEGQHSMQRYNTRIQRQNEFMRLATLAANRQISLAELTSAVADLLNAWQMPRTTAEKAAIELRQKTAVDLAVDMLNAASTEQRSHAAKRAASWAEDFQILARS